MTQTAPPTSRAVQPRLRRDLTVLDGIDGASRYRIVSCEISGRFTRTTSKTWQDLSQGSNESSLWNHAAAAGWTRQRLGRPKTKLSILYLKVPLGSIDRLATYLAALSSCLFSPTAIILWSIAMVLTGFALLGNIDALKAGLVGLPTYLATVNPIIPGGIFVGTKVMHELGHAVMCRRLGSRCGTIGVLFLCGMPCPYCDVTDIWRESSSRKRAMVMLAGIYVELIMAVIASVVWLVTDSANVAATALNVMLICSVSTIVFNANPLMRYDGYYVLSDLVGSVNLRQEASKAYDRMIDNTLTRRFNHEGVWQNSRLKWLAVYHFASLLYRIVVMLAIAGLIIQTASWVHLPMIGYGIVGFGAVNFVRKMFQ